MVFILSAVIVACLETTIVLFATSDSIKPPTAEIFFSPEVALQAVDVVHE
ncbi:hypothetical protein ADINL_0334 [Nitrincola lacisaponensis]|uniref:Uncharacterized protein n=1 Tax=Nitrincola lacisaponensis TaxID=267850 RepID=A0A063Y947_9GAMM|nr:hypothetical protein ADINL_0334 [Nitrincola lacisaponensis]